MALQAALVSSCVSSSQRVKFGSTDEFHVIQITQMMKTQSSVAIPAFNDNLWGFRDSEPTSTACASIRKFSALQGHVLNEVMVSVGVAGWAIGEVDIFLGRKCLGI